MPRSTGRAAGVDPDAGLAILGVSVGESVRWRSSPTGRWQHGTLTRRERDGSIGVTDRDGAARSIGVERIEIGRRGRRGGRTWEPLSVRAGRCEQLSLLPLPD